MDECRTATDEQLAERARRAAEGDTHAFEELVRRHQGHIVTNCRYITRSTNDAEDLAQEVFVKAFFRIEQFEGRSAFRSWLQRIKLNHCLNFLRRRSDRVSIDIADPNVQSDPALAVGPEADATMRSRDRRRAVGRVLDAMSDTLRVPLLMRDMDGLSYQEIADLLGIGLSAAKMRVTRARAEFRRLHDELFPSGPARDATTADAT